MKSRGSESTLSRRCSGRYMYVPIQCLESELSTEAWQQKACVCYRTVRSETSGVLGAMAKSVGKGLAPYLKALAGSWWLAQFDLHAEAAAAARDAFQAAFAGPKQKEALLFTRTEVGTRLWLSCMHYRNLLAGNKWSHTLPVTV